MFNTAVGAKREEGRAGVPPQAPPRNPLKSKNMKTSKSSTDEKARLMKRLAKAHLIDRLKNDYFVFVGGEQLGPMKITELWDLWWKGRLNDYDQYWTPELTEWMPIPALYHSRGIPYVRPVGPQYDSQQVSNMPGEYSERVGGTRCSHCNGPAFPKSFGCCSRSGCGVFCRQCMNEISDVLRTSEGCPICRGRILVKK